MVDPSDNGEPSGAEDRLSRMGIERILPADVSAEDLGRAIVDAVESGPPATVDHFAGGFVPYTGTPRRTNHPARTARGPVA